MVKPQSGWVGNDAIGNGGRFGAISIHRLGRKMVAER